jgi:MFS transporter, Spinster family, sphingosine-1-phosphate transporter
MRKSVSSRAADTRKNTIRSRSPNYVFTLLFAISFLNYMDRYVFVGASDTIGKELHLSLAQIGYVTSSFIIIYAISTIPLGIWADRSKRRDVVAVCVTIWSFATAITALTINFFSLFVSRAILGIGEAGYFPAGTALLSDYFARAKRSRIMSWWNIGQYVGILAGFGIGGALAGLYLGSWRLGFLITGIPGLLLAFLIWRVHEPRRNQADEEASQQELAPSAPLEQTPQPAPAPAHPNSIWQQTLTLLRIKTLVVLIVMQVFAFFVLGVNVTYLPIYLHQSNTFGLTTGFAGLYSGVVVVLGGLVGNTAGGYLADLIGRWYAGARVLVCGIGFLLCAPVYVLAVTSRNFPIFTLLFFLSVALLAIYNGPSTAATQDIVPSWLRASSIALSLLIAHLIGDAFSPTLVGVLATNFDPTHGMHFQLDTAGADLSRAFLITCAPALVLAGLVSIFGSRWMKADVVSAEQADQQRRQQEAA